MKNDSEIAFECVVSADLFRRAQMAVSKEETRYYLNGVHVSPAAGGGAVLTATDGTMLISMHDPDAYISGEAMVMLNKLMLRALAVSGSLIEQRLVAVRVLKGHTKPRAFVVDQRRPANGDGVQSAHLAARSVFDDPDSRVRAAQFSTLTIDGNFPDWRRVLPAELDPASPIGAVDNCKLVVIAKALTTRGITTFRMTAAKDNPRNSPIVVTGSSAVRGFAILMPLREDAPDNVAVPAWALSPPAAKAA